MPHRSSTNVMHDPVQHIKVLPANLLGKDYAMSDIHGYTGCLEAVLKNMKSDDRLFIAGDLVDRGGDNIGVLRLIQGRPNIFCVKGNHEVMCETALGILENQLRQLRKIYSQQPYELTAKNLRVKAEYNAEVANYIKPCNGGAWLLDLFLAEIANGKIHVENGQICYDADSEIKLVKEYLASVSYIVHVKSNHETGFVVVHADKPINDDELIRRSKIGSTQLSEDEKTYCVWARATSRTVPFQHDLHHPFGMPAIVGHNVIFDPSNDSVRKNANALNLDSESYYGHIALVVNKTDKKLQMVFGNEQTIVEIELVIFGKETCIVSVDGNNLDLHEENLLDYLARKRLLSVSAYDEHDQDVLHRAVISLITHLYFLKYCDNILFKNGHCLHMPEVIHEKILNCLKSIRELDVSATYVDLVRYLLVNDKFTSQQIDAYITFLRNKSEAEASTSMRFFPTSIAGCDYQPAIKCLEEYKQNNKDDALTAKTAPAMGTSC